MNISTLKKFDKEGMYKIYDNWPQISRQAYNYSYPKIELHKINHIVFAGMGGSGAIGDTFQSIFSKTNIHISVVKGYLLPNTVDKNSLIIVTSISGNTIETLSVLKSAKEKNCKIIAFSSGGKIEKYCKKFNINYRKIPQDHSPRASFARFLYSLLKILKSITPLTEKDVIESIVKMEILEKKISSKNLTKLNPSLELAKCIKEIPVIYYPYGLNAVAIRFKNSLQENTKIHAIAEDVIEASHNGIVSWERKTNVFPILIQGKDDYIKTKERWKILKQFFNKKEIKFYEVKSVQGNILSKIINLIYLLDYTSIYKAILDEIDPSPVPPIDYIKSQSNSN